MVQELVLSLNRLCSLLECHTDVRPYWIGPVVGIVQQIGNKQGMMRSGTAMLWASGSRDGKGKAGSLIACVDER